jgi:hypothetical protein
MLWASLGVRVPHSACKEGGATGAAALPAPAAARCSAASRMASRMRGSTCVVESGCKVTKARREAGSSSGSVVISLRWRVQRHGGAPPPCAPGTAPQTAGA